MPVRQFLARYWQRRPLLIRNAIKGLEAPITPAALFELARRDEVESRLIQDRRGACSVDHGPFARRRFPPRTRAGWTLLVQGVDQHLQAGADLVSRFRFLPDARLDDLMVSYATDRGGVGPHVDSYDVFLLQAHGQRRWRVQRNPDPACLDGLPIQRLARFRPDEEWVLGPGDMLYLPPGVAHDGVAQGECMTCSIGFRTPSWDDLANIWTELQAEQRRRQPGAYRDPGLVPSAHPARLPSRLVASAVRELGRWRPSRVDVATALLRQLSEPKPRVIFERPRHPLARSRFEAIVRRKGLQADRRTRMLYSGQVFAINGELVEPPDPPRLKALAALADRRTMPPGDVAGACLSEQLFQWYLAGWLHPPS
jgi:50S ribosomal protein L16 3-hydroxylase